MVIWNILRPFGIFYGPLVISGKLVCFRMFWSIALKKSGNPELMLEGTSKTKTGRRSSMIMRMLVSDSGQVNDAFF
jgi:hypothetical protein